ncbi:MAG: FtsW/RodA/SpoVE family cell cycle protein [Ruminococcus sp.]|nr:FtsW/RodA/SpoVE family cell cycle protein [Ruminococcus sp.]
MPQNQTRTAGKKQPRPKKQKRLSNNKTMFKFLMPKSSYLENIRVGEIDIPFLILILVLLVFGLIMMYSSSYAWAISEDLSPDYYFKRQLMMAGIGMIAMIFLASPFFDYHIFKHPAITFGFFGLCVFLMLILHLPQFSSSQAEAERWLKIGSLSFQPSEPMKLAMILLFAHMMASNHRNKDTFRYGILPYISIIGGVAFLTMWQRHLSGTIIVCCIGLAMMFVGGANLKYFIPLCITGAASMAGLIYLLMQSDKFSYISDRIYGWLYTFDPDINVDTWQTRNSLIAIGSGGVFGLGLGNSRQKFLYLPESKNDFIFAIVCEELGFVGASVVLILFLMLIFKGFSIAENAPDKYGMLLASGLVIQIGVQALLNIAVVTNTIPNTGISLPFFSYGGSALVMQLAQMGIVLNVSRQSMPRKGRADSSNAAEEAELKQIQSAKNRLRTGKTNPDNSSR